MRLALFLSILLERCLPFQRDILGHPSGTGYTFWGHSIGLNESASLYRFFEVIFWIEFPSFAAVFPLARRLLPYEFSDGFFLGLSEDARLLLLVMIVSSFQWYVIGRVLARISRRLSGFHGLNRGVRF
jgi:hypothetical protein